MSEDNKTVLVGRLRPTSFIVNYNGYDGNRKKYVFAGSKGNIIDKKQLPQYVVDDLLMTGVTFSDGELVVLDEKSKETKSKTVEGIDDVEKYENNSNSTQDIEKILGKSLAEMKKALSKIDVLSEKQFVIKVAKDTNLDSKGKLNFLAEWMGVKEELLFD